MTQDVFTTHHATDDEDFEAVETALRGLRVEAPPSLTTTTLVAVGLADEFAAVPSPIGDVFLAWNGRGVSFVSTAGDPTEFETRFRAVVARPIRQVDAAPARLQRAFERRMEGDRRASISLDLRGRAPFERAVWEKALEIPRGEVRPYGWIAAEIGRPRAVRAVGSALGRNPVPLVVPCHRVVRSDGTIGQYSMGGPETKVRVLSAEGVDVAGLQELAGHGIRFVGSDTTGIVCLPTCHNARRITDRHRVPFRSLASAVASGYRACLDCRPSSGSSLAA